jgi:hypothetical protein
MARSLRWLRGVKAGLTSRGRGSGFAGAAEGRGRRLGARRGRRAALDWGHVALPGSAGLGWVGVKGDPGEGEQADTPFVTPCTRLVHTSLHGALRPALARPLAPGAVRHRRARPTRCGAGCGAAGPEGGTRRGGSRGRGRGGPTDRVPGEGEVCLRAACSRHPLWFSYSSGALLRAVRASRRAARCGFAQPPGARQTAACSPSQRRERRSAAAGMLDPRYPRWTS